MRTLKNNHTLRLLGIFGISLLTMLVIVGGSTIIHQGVPPFAPTAHAATVNSSCATTKGTQPALCERQDPIVQGCVTDAQTLDLQTVFQDRLQTKPLGEVELRYSFNRIVRFFALYLRAKRHCHHEKDKNRGRSVRASSSKRLISSLSSLHLSCIR